MATIATERVHELTIPAGYVEDAYTAVARAIHTDAQRIQEDGPVERASGMVILARDVDLLQLLQGARLAEEDASVTGDSDGISSPIVDMLEGVVRQLADRLVDEAQFGPVRMDNALAIAEQVRWAAQEALRIDPGLGWAGGTVTLDRQQRDGFCAFVHTYLAGHISPVAEWDELREHQRRLEQCGPILDALGWKDAGDADSYTVRATDALLTVARAIRRDVELTIRDSRMNEDASALAEDTAALAAIDAIEATHRG